MFMLFCAIAYAAKQPEFGSGLTFQKGDQTIDFYQNGTVVYSSNSGAPSRRGEWSVDTRSYANFIGNVTKPVPISIKIYVGDRTITMKGNIQYCPANGKDIRNLTLDGSTWKKW